MGVSLFRLCRSQWVGVCLCYDALTLYRLLLMPAYKYEYVYTHKYKYVYLYLLLSANSNYETISIILYLFRLCSISYQIRACDILLPCLRHIVTSNRVKRLQICALYGFLMPVICKMIRQQALKSHL